jgi:hypothetical protein
MSSLVNDIALDLREKYKVDEYFYPKISMDIDISQGLKGEIADITKVLQENGFEAISENVFRIMELKRKLLTRYDETTEGKKTTANFRRMLLEDIKPTGITIPIELVLVNGLIALVIYVIGRFAGSFADESGKIIARKLLEKDKERSKQLNMDIREYRFLKNEATILIQDGKTLVFLKQKLKEKQEKHM